MREPYILFNVGLRVRTLSEPTSLQGQAGYFSAVHSIVFVYVPGARRGHTINGIANRRLRRARIKHKKNLLQGHITLCACYGTTLRVVFVYVAPALLDEVVTIARSIRFYSNWEVAGIGRGRPLAVCWAQYLYKFDQSWLLGAVG